MTPVGASTSLTSRINGMTAHTHTHTHTHLYMGEMPRCAVFLVFLEGSRGGVSLLDDCNRAEGTLLDRGVNNIPGTPVTCSTLIIPDENILRYGRSFSAIKVSTQ